MIDLVYYLVVFVGVYWFSVFMHELGHAIVLKSETGVWPKIKFSKGDFVVDHPMWDNLDVFARKRVFVAGPVLGFVSALLMLAVLVGNEWVRFIMIVCMCFPYLWGCMHDIVQLIKLSKPEHIDTRSKR